MVFPILHGPLGEDGTVQGLLKLAEIPFVGSDVLGAALGMDKDVMKRLLRDAGLPIADFLVLKSHEPLPQFQWITERLGLPFFIKPANMGSSVGISKVHAEAEYRRGIEEAFSFDTKIIFERQIDGREIECSVLGNEEPIASVAGEIISDHEFYSYEAKYLNEAGSLLSIPARIPAQTLERVQSLALETFRILECEGLARVDFFFRIQAISL